MKDHITRICGGCTACCKTHAVESISKEANTWCPSCSIGRGCTRYADRPLECAEFSCGWLYGEGSERDRPDKSGLVLSGAAKPGIGDMFTIHESRPGAFQESALARAWLALAAQNQLPTYVVPLRGTPTLFIPRSRHISNDMREQFSIEGISIAHYTA